MEALHFKRQMIHPQTYCLLKGKQPQKYYNSLQHRIEHANRILETVAKYFNITKEQLLKKDRRKEIVIPRQIAIYLIKIRTKLDDGKIGEIIKKDRTTAIHSINLINDYYSVGHPEKILQDIESLKGII
jgi:chromosomal replication initiation ATPase DnaA